MKETRIRTSVDLDVIVPTTGEIIKVTGNTIDQTKYYSIKKLTSRINTMDMLEIMAQICRSSKDIELLKVLLDMTDKYNELRIDNITELAKTLNISRVKLTTLLKKMVDKKLTCKLDRGIYLVNPFVYTGKRVKSNEVRENLQKVWNEKH